MGLISAPARYISNRSIHSALSFGWLILFLLPSLAHAARNGPNSDTAEAFRWIHPSSNTQLWKQVESAFHDELAPDEGQVGHDALDVYRYKYLERVGILDSSILVIICHRPEKQQSEKNAWDEYCSAFNFEMSTGQKSQIEHAEWMWKWKFLKLAKFGPGSVPDVTFTYLTCTECEPETMLASLFYDTAKSAWSVRSWGDGKTLWWTASDGLVVDMDVNNGGDTISFDCAYGILAPKNNGFQDVVIRCKEITATDKGRAKTQDSTVLYSLLHGQFKGRQITDESEALGLTAKLCRPNSSSWLCRLPGYMTMTSGQNEVLNQMFPQAPKTSRELSCFRNLKRSTTMSEVVQRCGVPDELGGSGINIFIYHLDDSSVLAIGATGTTTPLMYAIRTTSTGKSSELIPAK